MSRIPQTFLDDLINRIDIVEIIDQRVKLKRSGKNYSACCPFHEEKTPSFTVSPDKQFYYCFGCGANGTALSFVIENDRIGFIDAVELLAKRAGMEVPRAERSTADIQKDTQRKRLYEMLDKAASYYEEQLKEHGQRKPAVKYLQERGLSGGIAKLYRLGFAPPGWDNLLLRLSQNESDKNLLVSGGLLVEKKDTKKLYDSLRNRIIYPIRDGRGRVIGFGGRVLGDDKPKYLNSPETPVFEKGRELYGLWEARQQNRNLEFLIVVEGYMDVIALSQYQIWNAVATLGTACGEEHLNIAFRHVNEVVFCFDGDNAGRKAARRALLSSLSAMQDGRQIRFLFLPEGQDPDTLVRQIGDERFRALIKKATPLEEFLFDIAAEDIDLNSMEGRARFSKNAAPLIHQLPEGVFRSLMFDNLAKRTGLSSEVLSELTEIPEELNRREPEPKAAEHPTAPVTLDQNHESLAPEYSQAFDEQPHYPADYYESPPQHHASPTQNRKKTELSPARRATILLLDQPKLLAELETQPADIPELSENQTECKTLFEIVRYLQKRPEANFNNIVGFWGGSKGVEAQQDLANLIANEFFGSVKALEAYNPLTELEGCFATLSRQERRLQQKKELKTLNSKGLRALNEEERRRYLELIKIGTIKEN
ncbi:MAG: DNA primase [Flavobacteriales bacterium]|jgi:DNA primase